MYFLTDDFFNDTKGFYENQVYYYHYIRMMGKFLNIREKVPEVLGIECSLSFSIQNIYSVAVSLHNHQFHLHQSIHSQC